MCGHETICVSAGFQAVLLGKVSEMIRMAKAQCNRLWAVQRANRSWHSSVIHNGTPNIRMLKIPTFWCSLFCNVIKSTNACAVEAGLSFFTLLGAFLLPCLLVYHLSYLLQFTGIFTSSQIVFIFVNCSIRCLLFLNSIPLKRLICSFFFFPLDANPNHFQTVHSHEEVNDWWTEKDLSYQQTLLCGLYVIEHNTKDKSVKQTLL